MNYWLLKSEPDVYSFDTLLNEKKGIWDGVRNYQARNNLKLMRNGDLAFFYHSNIGKEIVGVIKIIKEYYPDPTATDGDWVVVEVEPFCKLKKQITLEMIKKDLNLQNIGLIKQSRLSVMSIKKEEFDYILALSES